MSQHANLILMSTETAKEQRPPRPMSRDIQRVKNTKATANFIKSAGDLAGKI